MINTSEFLQHFSNQFDETDITFFKIDTEYKNLEEWGSMVALMIIAMIDEFYNVKISGEDIRQSTTIGDLINIVNSKVNIN